MSPVSGRNSRHPPVPRPRCSRSTAVLAGLLATALVACEATAATPGVPPGAPAQDAPPLVAVDVGHSLAKPGAVSARGVPEFRFNRELAGAVAAALRQRRMRVLLIGEQGDADSLVQRTTTAAGADLLLSLHHDSVQPHYLESWQVDGRTLPYSDRFSGFSLFVSRRNPDVARSLACARSIGAALRGIGQQPSLHHAEPIKGEGRPLVDAANGIYYFDGLVVLRTATSPAVLLEAGLIVNREDELRLGDPRQQAQMASAVADGVRSCLAAMPRSATLP